MYEDDEDWIIPPPEPGTMAFAFRSSPDVELSPAVVEALETLSRELTGNDTTGFMTPKDCGDVYSRCRDGRCRPVVIGPCFLLTSCRIA